MKKIDTEVDAGIMGPEVVNTAKAIVPAKAKSTQIKKQADDNDLLNEQEEALFADCEADIQQNLRGTFILGWRLEQIRDQKLYRQTHKTFEGYCRERWDFSKSHANRHIKAHVCEEYLKSIKDNEVYVPTKESQVRYIADLEPEQQVEVARKVKQAVGSKQASAGDFGVARQELFPKPKRDTENAKQIKNEVEPDLRETDKPEFDPNLVSIPEIQKIVKDIYHIYINSSRKQDGLNMFAKLQRDLAAWADWEKEQRQVMEAA